MTRWMLSTFYDDVDGNIQVVCAAYGNDFMCPGGRVIPNGLVLVLVATSPTQMEAAEQDPRVFVMPAMIDPSPVPQLLVDTYASWGVTAGMGMAQVICKLAEREPRFYGEL